MRILIGAVSGVTGRSGTKRGETRRHVGSERKFLPLQNLTDKRHRNYERGKDILQAILLNDSAVVRKSVAN